MVNHVVNKASDVILEDAVILENAVTLAVCFEAKFIMNLVYFEDRTMSFA